MKTLTIAWKEILTTFRDRTALITMLAAPFLLSLVMLFAFGSSGSIALEDIPVVIVNDDAGPLGQMLVDVFFGKELEDLLEPSLSPSIADAMALVDDDKAAAAVLIPAALSESLMTADNHATAESGQFTPFIIQVYENPGRSISADIIGGITDTFVSRVIAGYTSNRLIWEELIAPGYIPAEAYLSQSSSIEDNQSPDTSIVITTIERDVTSDENSGFDWAQYMGPSMAILFLMFSVTRGGRSLLVEQDWGTLPRMLISPTRPAQILGGKVLGIFGTGLLQMLILLAATRLFIGVSWGPFIPTLAVIAAVSLAATAWGIFIGVWAHTPAQAGNFGAALSLIFGAAAGNFVPRIAMPEFLQKASLISPNAWGLEAFQSLLEGGGMQQVISPIIGLLTMALILGSISVIIFRNRHARTQP